MPVTAIYAGLLGLVFLALSIRVIGLRRQSRVDLGDGGDKALRRRIRVHGNFAEYTPMALILIGLAESMAAPVWLLHALGLALLAGRSVHALGVSREPEPFQLRVAGMMLTFTVIGLAALTDLWLGLARDLVAGP